MKIKINKTKKWKYTTGLYEHVENAQYLNRKVLCFRIDAGEVFDMQEEWGQDFHLDDIGNELWLASMFKQYIL